MEKITRRNFVRNAIRISSGVAVFGGFSPLTGFRANRDNTGDNIKVFIPMPIQIVIDDVGWWSGEDGSKRQEMRYLLNG